MYPSVMNKFCKNISGNMAVLTSFLAIPMFGAAGLALDYSALSNTKTQMQAAADAAALAAALEFSEKQDESDIAENAKKFFVANGLNSSFYSQSEVTGELKGTFVEVTATANVPTYLMGVMGFNDTKVHVVSQATTVGQAPVEMALVIDNTRSMDFGSWPQVRNALSDVLDAIESRTSSDDFYVTLVPFTNRVNIGLGRDYWVEAEDKSGTWEGCVEPFQTPIAGFPYALDFAAAPGDFAPTTDETAQQIKDNGTRHSECARPIIGPTKDIDEAKAGLRDLSPKRATGRFDDALLWGWRAVTEQWQGRWNGDPNYPSENGERQKIVAMFTDGKTNINEYEMEEQPGEFGNNKGSISLFEHFTRVCNMMKADSVDIYIFDTAQNRHAAPYFKTCAEEEYYEVKTTDAMIEAIRNLSGGQQVEVRLSK